MKPLYNNKRNTGYVIIKPSESIDALMYYYIHDLQNEPVFVIKYSMVKPLTILDDYITRIEVYPVISKVSSKLITRVPMFSTLIGGEYEGNTSMAILDSTLKYDFLTVSLTMRLKGVSYTFTVYDNTYLEVAMIDRKTSIIEVISSMEVTDKDLILLRE